MTTQAKKRFLFLGTLIGVITACLGLETQHSNHLGWALLFSGAAFTTVGCLYLGPMFIQTRPGPEPKDRSLWLPALGALIISLVTPLEYRFLPPVLPRSDHLQDIGIILFAGGLAFYLLSLQSAEPWHIPIFKDARKFTTIDRIVLCPISASLLLFVFGLGIGYSSLMGLLVIFVLVLPGLFNRMHGSDQRVNPIT